MSCVTSPSMGSLDRRGQIQVIFGPMFSGKSTELIRRMKRYQIAKYECLVVKYANDVRYSDDGVATHDKQVLTAVSAMKLYDIKDQANASEVIGIDEGQFFPDIVEFCEKMADIGKIVIVAALDGTFQRKGFGNILELIPLAESIIKLNAVCMRCFGEASFTKRTSNDQDIEVIGGADMYIATCRQCFHLSPHKEVQPFTVSSPKCKQPSKASNKENSPLVKASPKHKAVEKVQQQVQQRPVLAEKNIASRKLFTTPDH